MPFRVSLIVVVTSLLGGGSLLLLGLFLFFGPFQMVDFKLGIPATLGLDAALCLAFIFQHSTMIRKSFRHHLERFIPLHYHGVFYTLASGSILIIMLIFWQDSGLVLVNFEGGLYWALIFIFFAGISVFILGGRALKSFDAFGIRLMLTRLADRPERTVPLSIKGPYRWVRHPLYFSTLVLIWSCPVVTADRLLFNIIFTLWIVIGTKLEERDLVTEFGSAYREYQRKVPMLIPWKFHLWFGTSGK
jgi:protein-S-isoprenylcysteine O-methyltransferase Ste14